MVRKIFKWIGIALAVIVGVIVVRVAVYLVYINWEGKKTPEQSESLDMIKNIQNAPQPAGYSSKVSDDAPEIYQDQRDPEKFSASGDKDED